MKEQNNKYNFGILSVPLDYTSTRRKGSAYGPKAILNSLWKGLYVGEMIDLRNQKKFIVKEKFVKEYDELSLNIDTEADIIKENNRIEEYVSNLSRQMFPVILGGDHSITYASFKGVNKAFKGKLALIIFDAHPDVWDHYPNLGRYWHGSFLRRLIDEEIIDSRDVYLIGLRGYIENEIYEYLVSNKINFYTSYDVAKFGIENILNEITNKMLTDVSNFYLSIDVDCLDPCFAAGTGTPEFEGLSPTDLLRSIEILSKEQIKALDIVEVNPLYDKSQITEFFAAELLWRFLMLHGN